jgi:RNA polymerase sigma-70 factor, ECF subfamily
MSAAARQRDDRELAIGFHEGEPDAIREVYRLFSGPLFALSRSMLSNPDHARDAVQQTFVRAWQAAGQYDPGRPLSAWLYTICRRVCIDRYRQERRPSEALTATGAPADMATDGPSIERAWTVWEVRRAIEELPSDEREVVRLFNFEGWSLPEIADHLGIPLGTVKSRSFRAHRKLAKMLGHLRESELEESIA